MNGSYYVGAIGLQAEQRALEAISNNIANMNTPGFKRSEVRFSDVLANSADPANPSADLTTNTDSLAGVIATPMLMVDQQGSLEATGQPMDIAIQGAGFIELMGADGQSLLWRGGSLKVNDDGQLATESGIPLRANITVPQDATAITIASDGTVSATTSGSANPVQLGQISLARVDDNSALEALDGGLYRVGDDARVIEAKAGEDGAGLLVQGSVEGSNVDMTDEMVQLMLVQRGYAANAQLVQAADQLMSIDNGLRR
jgi:flagellar basal-body rod protein FlgG